MSDCYDKCDKETIIHQLLKVQAQVSVEPLVEHGPPKVQCIRSSVRPGRFCNSKKYPLMPNDKCTYILTQVICVEIPIKLDVDVDIDQGIVCCGTPEFGPCEPPCNTRDDIR